MKQDLGPRYAELVRELERRILVIDGAWHLRSLSDIALRLAGQTVQVRVLGPYAIPEEALQSDRFDNLLAAGACVSATRAATASLRAAGICLATGDAAGRLAASV